MPVTSGKYEAAIVHLLNVSPEKRLDVLLRISGDLLKFINGDDAWFIRFFQKIKQ